jgi:hypothetical protein
MSGDSRARSVIMSFYRDNIPSDVVSAQAEIVNRMRPETCDFMQIKADSRHGAVIDWFLGDSDYDQYFLLDIDAIPLNPMIVPYMLYKAATGSVIGNIQRSNHIQNGRHVFAAPSFMAFSRALWNELGRPSFLETSRADVGEELTFSAETLGVPLELFRPSRVLGDKCWALDGSDDPQYGVGTFFQSAGIEVSFHNFQSRFPREHALFLDVCNAVLGRSRGKPTSAAVPGTDTNAITIITTCKGRLAHLSESLPRMVAQEKADCVVVDYGCPEGAGAWARERFPQVRVVNAEGAEHFNRSRAKNLGASGAQTEWLAFVDADVLLNPDFLGRILPTLSRGRFYRPAPVVPDTWGTCIVSREDFWAVGGFDEAMRGWGGEDDDLYHRLIKLRGCLQETFSADLLQPIEHSDEDRLAHAGDDATRWVSQRANALYLHVKYDLMRTLAQPNLHADLRNQLYQEVRRTVLADAQKGGTTTRIEVSLPTEPEVPLWGWRLKRTWTFELDKLPGVPDSPFETHAVES